MFLHSNIKMKMGKGGVWLKKSFFSDLESGKGSIHVNQGREVVAQTRDYGDFSKYQLKYLPIDYGIIMHRMVRVDYRRGKRKKKKRADFSTVPWPWAKSGRPPAVTWSVPV